MYDRQPDGTYELKPWVEKMYHEQVKKESGDAVDNEEVEQVQGASVS
jgi:hypothetical protein